MTTTTHEITTHRTVTLIAAIGLDRTIGLNNTMPWHLPEDLQHFKAKTLGKTMIMGRNTFESIGKPLAGRKTVILSKTQKNSDYSDPNCQVAHTIEQAFAIAQETTPHDGDIIIAGGGQVYQLALPFATHLSITQIQKNFYGDTFFPKWEEKEWTLQNEEHHQQPTEQGLKYSFQTFERTQL